MLKKHSFYLFAFLILIFGIAAIFGSYIWFSHKQERVMLGLAKPVWPYSDYSVAELNKLYPQYANEDVATTQTPEQTHAKFIAALKKGNLDEAVRCCFREGDQERVKEFLFGVKHSDYFSEMINDLQNIKLENKGETMASYSYLATLNGKKVGNIMMFNKNNRGVWLIDSF